MTDRIRSSLLPVLDLKEGHVVRGVGGRRNEYRPIVSRWTASSEPVEVARALRDRFGLHHFYVADLDAICEGTPHRQAISALVEEGFTLDVDAGVRSERDCAAVLEHPGCRSVIGLETLDSPAVLEQIVHRLPSSRLVFSIDLKQGASMGSDRWPRAPMEIAARVMEAGVESLILLDLAAVGSGNGCPTLALCRAVRAQWPRAELITGGGIRDGGDVKGAVDSGADRVLVASALHDGRID